ncbi:MAG: hypothetical protein L3J53_02560 [Proteobacteria bacterium]|nr:hypothetical protein [Pseudomonadota bacterium]
MALREKTYFRNRDLGIPKGEITCGIKELNGWAWVKRKLNGDEGWLPLVILKEMSKKKNTL